jgi:hypothetical protein
MDSLLSIEKDEKHDAEVCSKVECLELYSENYPFSLPLRIKNFESEAEFTKFIRCCERHVRNSLEYRAWKNYIIDVLGIHTCMITNERMDQVTIEVHHHIPSLFVLVKALVNKRLSNEEEFSTFDVALEAIEMHFKNKVGYTTLIKSIHEKFHNGFLAIPVDYVKGDFRSFLSEYTEFMEDEDLDTITQRLSINESNCGWGRNEYPGQIADAM